MSVPNRRHAPRAESLALLIEAVQDYAIFMLTPDGHVATWNLGAQRIKGYSADEIIGQHFSVFYTPEERKAGRPVRLLGWARERGRFEDEGWRVRSDGSRFWADVVVTAIRDRSGALLGFGKVTRDLTERRAAEEQQRALLVEQRARAAAETALQARDRFLGIASHELKTPVASIQLATESLQRALGAGRMDEERLRAGLRRLANANARLSQLVDELLDVSRLTGERQSLQLSPVDVAELAHEVVARFAAIHGSDRLALDASAPVMVEADASRLDQVLTNLVDNGLKYSEASSSVEVAVHEADSGAELVVADRGIGLDVETADRIFEAFGRGLNAEHVQGLGLGLYICHQIVVRHGGKIAAARREDGTGSVFRVWVPKQPGGRDA